MKFPYEIPQPAIISFSGGRTSGYMLKHIIEAFGGSLPSDVKVVFANTGKELPETLDFIHRCSVEWSVPVAWLEYDPDAEFETAIVNHNSAARNGEPFRKLIEKKAYLPNPVTRICTHFLKVKRIQAFANKICEFSEWANIVGLRWDERRRVYSLMARCGRRTEGEPYCPLFRAKVTESDVRDWWDEQSFDLEIESHESNCDLCFLKGAGKIARIMRDRPKTVKWWSDMEALALALASKPSGARFRQDRPLYKDMFANVVRQGDLLDGYVEQWDWDGDECVCTD